MVQLNDNNTADISFQFISFTLLSITIKVNLFKALERGDDLEFHR